MSSAVFAELLSLPARARADIAIALWESLSDAERNDALILEPSFVEELDRRWREHLANPETAIPWQELVRSLKS